MTKNVFIIAGEASGDFLGASLMKAAKDSKFSGIGGPLMEAQGLKSLYPMDDLCVMGLFEVLDELPRLLKLINSVVEDIEAAQPDMVLTIDIPDFSFQVVKRLKKRGKVNCEFVHYVAPTVWAWRAGRAKKVAKLYDKLLCVLPFEPPYFTPHGLDAFFAGHPLVERNMQYDSKAFREECGFAADDKVVGLFLGSRSSEFKLIAPQILEAAKIVQQKEPSVKFLVPTLPNKKDRIEALLKAHDVEAVIATDQDKKWDGFAACDAAMAVSGTVGLELAYLGVPHVVGYKAHPVTAALLKRLVKLDHIHLANIILESRVIEEYLQEECTAENLSAEVLSLLNDDKGQKEKLKILARTLGQGEDQSPSEKAAAFLKI